MRRIIASLLAVFLVLPGMALASAWNIDPVHSHIGFKVRHLMVSNVKGSFDRYTATIDLDEQELTRSRVTVTIDTASINTAHQKRDEHLRSADFFDVARHPTMTYVAKSITNIGNGRFKVTGDLTLRGVTREVVLDVEGLTQEIRDPWGNLRRGATATVTINRKDFGLVWNKAMETGGVVVGDEVAITLEIELTRDQGNNAKSP